MVERPATTLVLLQLHGVEPVDPTSGTGDEAGGAVGLEVL